jgi:apolipoprotein N-acyltransferase
MNDRRIVIIVNPTISGWMGADESNGSVHQARARAIETGMILYRSGQTHGTEAFVPWGKYAIRGLAVRPLGGGTIQVGVYVPKLRPVTPYMSFTWMLAMLLMPASALVIVIGWAVPSARKDILTVGESR